MRVRVCVCVYVYFWSNQLSVQSSQILGSNYLDKEIDIFHTLHRIDNFFYLVNTWNYFIGSVSSFLFDF